jgi:hypothetical protein
MATEYIKHPTTGKEMRTPLIVGMDPGQEKGYAIVDPEDMVSRKSFDAPRVIAMGTSISEVVAALPAKALRDRPIWAAVEFQYAQRVTTGEISADSIIKLAFRAGYMLAECLHVFGAEETFAAVPTRWKIELYSCGATLAKDKYTARLMREMMPDELRALQKIEEVDQKYVDDVVDAIGIAWAAWHMSKVPTRFREWRCDPDHIIPLVSYGVRKKRFQSSARTPKTAFRPKEVIRK